MPGYHLRDLGDETYRDLKIACAILGKTISEFLQEAVAEKIASSGIPTEFFKPPLRETNRKG